MQQFVAGNFLKKLHRVFNAHSLLKESNLTLKAPLQGWLGKR